MTQAVEGGNTKQVVGKGLALFGEVEVAGDEGGGTCQYWVKNTQLCQSKNGQF